MELMEEKNTPTMEIYTRANQLSPLPFLNTLSPITSTRAPQLKEKKLGRRIFYVGSKNFKLRARQTPKLSLSSSTQF